jgi:hypothetical protein
MSGVFRNIDPIPLAARRVCTTPPPPLVRGGGLTGWVEMGWGVNSSEDARHCSVIYICKYFVAGLFVGKYNRSQIFEYRNWE